MLNIIIIMAFLRFWNKYCTIILMPFNCHKDQIGRFFKFSASYQTIKILKYLTFLAVTPLLSPMPPLLRTTPPTDFQVHPHCNTHHGRVLMKSQKWLLYCNSRLTPCNFTFQQLRKRLSSLKLLVHNKQIVRICQWISTKWIFLFI